jgi:hypothetical protein
MSGCRGARRWTCSSRRSFGCSRSSRTSGDGDRRAHWLDSGHHSAAGSGLRPLFVPPDPCQRTTYQPGELARFDLWQPDVEIPLGFGQTDKLWVVVGVVGFSQLIAAWMVPVPGGA